MSQQISFRRKLRPLHSQAQVFRKFLNQFLFPLHSSVDVPNFRVVDGSILQIATRLAALELGDWLDRRNRERPALVRFGKTVLLSVDLYCTFWFFFFFFSWKLRVAFSFTFLKLFYHLRILIPAIKMVVVCI